MSIENESQENWQPKIVGICCRWCTYAGADLAGISRMNYPTTVRVIRVPCSGRVNPQFIIRALQQGADGVFVSGCHPGDCHYSSGNYHARRRLQVLKKLLEFVGLEPERFQFYWISGSEGAKFAETMKKIDEQIKKLGPNKKLKRSNVFKQGDRPA
ncbi:MAG TPA: hydrogenase iron-sulfur subunit [Desulfotomaculum sp.]|nr:hydrogenase iron-sulfur subunit [Desulfotomaculum sp.]HBY04120.1 hydrogenase iron-sulfur subunit [Desulfotomaculum sp.]